MTTEDITDRHYVATLRRIDSATHAVHSYTTLEDFMSLTQVRAGVNTVWQGGLPIDFLVSPAESPVLVVVLNGAAPADITLPWLSGTGITKNLNVSKMFISDPSLYLGQGLTSAYYAGSFYQPALQQDLARLIEKVMMSVQAQHVVFLGGSSGGFASLYLGSCFPNSTSVVFNPQTNLWAHLPAPVVKWLTVAWGTKLLKDLPSNVEYDLTHVYSGCFQNRVVYMQNRTDHHHDRHFAPFMKKAGEGDLQYLVHDEARGHKPPPKEMIRDVLRQACSLPLGELIEGFQRR